MIQNGRLKMCLGVFLKTFFIFVHPELPGEKKHSKLTTAHIFSDGLEKTNVFQLDPL